MIQPPTVSSQPSPLFSFSRSPLQLSAEICIYNRSNCSGEKLFACTLAFHAVTTVVINERPPLAYCLFCCLFAKTELPDSTCSW